MCKRLHGLERSGQICSLIRTAMDGLIKTRLVAALALVLAASVLTALAPLAFKLLIDALGNSSERGPVPAWQLIVLYALSQWLARALNEARGLVYHRAERRLYRAVSRRLFNHVLHLPLRLHLGRQTAAIAQTLGNGLLGFQLVLQHALLTALPVAAELATVALVLSRLDQHFFLGILGVTVVSHACAFSISVARISGPARAAAAAHVDANAAMSDGLLNYEAIKYFTAESLMEERYDRALAHTEAQWLRLFRRKAFSGLLIATLFAVCMLVTLLHAGQAVQRGSMSVGDFVLVNLYLMQVIRPVELLGFALQDISQGAAFLDRMLMLLREPAEPQPTGPAIPLPSGGTLEFRHVGLSYSPGRSILKDVSFSVAPGRTLGIVGASGTGKSSLVRLLLRLLEPDTGQILFDGVPVAALPLNDWRGSIAVVPQDTALLDESIAYNIGLGRPGSSRADIEQAAGLAQLHEFVASLPERYDTRVGERGLRLSGGERQRISIARAALKRPGIFIFDEATSSLDSQTERVILNNLRELAGRGIALVIAHRLSAVMHADEIVVLHDGRVVERGTHRVLLAQNGNYARLWRAQLTIPCAAAD